MGDGSTFDECDLAGSVNGAYVHGNVITATFNRCVVTNNSGHGLYVWAKSGVRARNCLVAGNGGDGVYIQCDNSGRYSYLDYCTIANNTGDGYEDAHQYHWSTWMTNCIISGNDGYGYVRHGSAVRDNYVAYSCVYGNSSGDFTGARIVLQSGMITNQLPLLRPDYQLQGGSPCRDAGIDIGVAVDIAGVSRPVAKGFDMGAYEAPPSGSIVFIR
jgi:hypothetical protein